MPETIAGITQVFDMEFWLRAGTQVAKIAAIVALSLVVVKVGNSLIKRLFSQTVGKASRLAIDESRAKTLSGLLRSALRYAVGIVGLLMILDLFGIDTKALLGGAAVVGLAVGFGAQNLVRDIITGFFLIYEKQYDVGDYVTIAGVSGIVEQIGLRTTTLRDFSGDVHTVPNGLVEKTTNKSRREARALVEIPISHEANLRQAIGIMDEVCEKVRENMPVIQEGPRVLGVKQLGESGVVILVWAKTRPMSQWGVERELRLRIKEALDGAGIEHPYPRLVVRGEHHEPSEDLQ